MRETLDKRGPLFDNMSMTERFLRVLLFASQNHFFDLKNQMRRYLHVDEGGSRLEFDAQSLPEEEQRLAAFQFLLEQKTRLFRFSGGRDYANEILRDCLSGVFVDLGTDTPRLVNELYPENHGTGVQLTRGPSLSM
ncbi:MAG: hypothetical protein ACLP0J_29525 [Solirubrobacteraceae bacterium]